MSAVPPGVGAARWQAAPRQPGHGADLAAAHALDAYLVWDLLSGFSRHRGGPPGADPLALRDATGQPAWWAPVLVELAADAAMQTLAEQLAALNGLAAEGRWLARRLAPSLAGWPDSRIHGAIVPAPTLPALHAAVAQGLLARFQLGAPCADPGEVVATSRAAPPASADDRHLLGVVDDGCCLAHAHFRGADGLRSRIAWLWDQDPGARPAAPWGRYRGRSASAALAAPYGAELARRDIDALLRRHPGLGPQAEAGLYRALGRSAWGGDGRSHGARRARSRRREGRARSPRRACARQDDDSTRPRA